MSEHSIRALLAYGTETLLAASDSPRLDAELLLAHAIGKSRTYLHTWPENSIESAQVDCFKADIAKRLTDYPVAYITGKQGFWSLDLTVTPDVLIPRPETELLVEVALEKLANIETPKVLDLGTGSGAIALAIAKERPDAQVTATDKSGKALKVAKKNANDNKINNVCFIESDWFATIKKETFDLIVSNPPYIAPLDKHLKTSIRHEPQQALISEKEGMQDIALIIENSHLHLRQGGWLMLEHGFEQKAQTQELFTRHSFTKVDTKLDLNLLDRVSMGQKINPKQPNRNKLVIRGLLFPAFLSGK